MYKHVLGESWLDAQSLHIRLHLSEPEAKTVLHRMQTIEAKFLLDSLSNHGFIAYPNGNSVNPGILAFQAFAQSDRQALLTYMSERNTLSRPALLEALNQFIPPDPTSAEYSHDELDPPVQDVINVHAGIPIIDQGSPEDKKYGPHSQSLASSLTRHSVKLLLYHVAEEEAMRKVVVHHGMQCDICGTSPIRGIRWHCIHCPDFDLCSACESCEYHARTHVFAKIKVPIPSLRQPWHTFDPWYPGDPKIHAGPLLPGVYTMLRDMVDFDDSQFRAYYDQFVTIAKTPHPTDQYFIGIAIDQSTFNTALSSQGWPRPLAQNYLHERLFDYFDANKDGLIDFGDFLEGLASSQSSSRRMQHLQKTFDGYDADKDGYINRRDVVKMLTAKHAIQKQIVMDAIALEELNLMRTAASNVNALQPVSAVFTDADVPAGTDRGPFEKPQDDSVDPQPRAGGESVEAILAIGQDDVDDTFWNAVTKRYGGDIPIKDTLEARLALREKYTGDHATPVSESQGQRYRVPVDPRINRSVSKKQSEERETGDGQIDGVGESQPEDTYEVSAGERLDRQDVLWQVAEEGMNALLDALFARCEAKGELVRSSRAKRMKYRAEINTRVAARKRHAARAKDKRKDTATKTSPERSEDVATTLDGTNGQQVVEQARAVPSLTQADIRQEILNNGVSTDNASLQQMEDGIKEQSLEELLAASGYSMASPVEAQSEATPGTALPISATPTVTVSAPTPPIPQNEAGATMASTSSSPDASSRRISSLHDEIDLGSDDSSDADIDRPEQNASQRRPISEILQDESLPDAEKLDMLSWLDFEEAQIAARGGPGRMNFAEFEKYMTNEDNVRMKRLIVDGWLEWARF